MRVRAFEAYQAPTAAIVRAGQAGSVFSLASMATSPARVSNLAPSQGFAALAAVGDPLEKRRRGLRKGRAILAALDGLKLALLSGETAGAHLKQLAIETKGDSDFIDPELDTILAHIRLRAAVELAKAEARSPGQVVPDSQ